MSDSSASTADETTSRAANGAGRHGVVETSPASRPAGASWVGLVVRLDAVAAVLSFAATAFYLILKADNDQRSVFMRLIEEIARWFHRLEIHRMPGLPSDLRELRTFADPFFADTYLIAMAAIHLLAAAGFLSLAIALGRLRPWARRAHILVASLSLLILGIYACLYANAPAPRIGLYVMAGAAIVPAAVAVILLIPGIASLFNGTSEPRPEPSLHPRSRIRPRHGLALTLFLALYVLGSLATVLVVSVPVAIDLKRTLTPDQ